MVVIVVTRYIGYPTGTAATSRVHAYARGLAASGQEVRVILLGPSERDEASASNKAVTGVHQGIPFEYTSVSTVRHPSLVVRRWRLITSPLRARRRIRELDAQTGVEAILLYSRVPWITAFFRRVSREIGAIYAEDLCEMPYYWLASGRKRDAKQAAFGRKVIPRFDMIVAISSFLADYASRYSPPGSDVLLIPTLVDCDDYLPDVSPASNPRLVTYAGLLNEKKDGVATLLRAFASVASQHPDVMLRLVGDSYDPVNASKIPEFRGLAESLGILGRVEFVGQVDRAEIPRYLSEASVLVLARPSSQQADAGLPTKVSEYLAAGRPVIVTRTSDIADYVRDEESAYLVPPDDVEALAIRLNEVLSEPLRAAEVGRAGRLVAERSFDYRPNGRVLASALQSRKAR